jgi:hypothetical protein
MQECLASADCCFTSAWTSFPSITWVPQVLSSIFIGAGMLIAFWQGINYMMDCYAFYSNSAIAVNTFIRSIAGAVFPLFAPIMCKKLDWKLSINNQLTISPDRSQSWSTVGDIGVGIYLRGFHPCPNFVLQIRCKNKGEEQVYAYWIKGRMVIDRQTKKR